MPHPSDTVKATYVRGERLLAFDPDAISEQAAGDAYFSKNLQRYAFLYHLMPWEVYRARRALDYTTAAHLTNTQAIDDALRLGEPTVRLAQREIQAYHDLIQQTTPLLRWFTAGYWGGSVDFWLQCQAQLNSARLLLALEGHRLEHGSLPSSLDELVGDYFEKLPRDPYSGDSFRYFPHGVPTSERIHYGLVPSPNNQIAAGVPFLWSCGPFVLRVTRRNNIDDVYLQIGWDGRGIADPLPLLKILPEGWATTIPQGGGAAQPAVDDETEQDVPPAAGDVRDKDRDHQDDAAPPPAEPPPDETPAETDSSGEPLTLKRTPAAIHRLHFCEYPGRIVIELARSRSANGFLPPDTRFDRSPMPLLSRSPILSPLGILLVALSLSIGWGIRGNYGHETGAMFPGAIAAIAVCLLSGRADWRERVVYFAFFGAFGWAFGGSISYMQVIGYTHSGHFASQAYGFACLFVIGFLWGSLGGGGTALPAALDRQRLTQMFVPMLVVLAAMGAADYIIPLVNDKMQVEAR